MGQQTARLRTLSSSKWEDSFMFSGMQMNRKNSFEALIDQKENEYRQAVVDSYPSVENRPYKGLLFEYLNNPAPIDMPINNNETAAAANEF